MHRTGQARGLSVGTAYKEQTLDVVELLERRAEHSEAFAGRVGLRVGGWMERSAARCIHDHSFTCKSGMCTYFCMCAGL